MEFSENKPIYIQIAENMAEQVLSGELTAGARIPSVREWGSRIGVNPNTVARSYDYLSSKGVIRQERGIGFFICDDALQKIKDEDRRRFIDEEVPQFLRKAALLGVDLKELL